MFDDAFKGSSASIFRVKQIRKKMVIYLTLKMKEPRSFDI
jgi:hypothetical protein